MPVTVTSPAKNNAPVTNTSKTGSTRIWDESTATWVEETGTWDAPGAVVTRPSKNSTTVTNTPKT